MTRRDFIIIAEIIRDRIPTSEVQQVAEVFAEGLKQTNPRFKPDLFVQAATGIVPLTARKAR